MTQAIDIKKTTFLTVAEFAALVRMSEWAIYQALRGDEIPGAKKIGGSWRIHRRTALRAFGVDVDQ